MEEKMIEDLGRHYSVLEVFKDPMLSVRGFVEKSYSKGMHSQEFYEVNIVLSGSAFHRIGNTTYTVSSGDTFIIPPNVMHGYAGGEGFDVYHILISPKYLEKHSADLRLLPAFSSMFIIDPLMREKASARLHFTLTPQELNELTPMLDGLTDHSGGAGAENAIIAGAEALVIITRLCGIYENRDTLAGAEDTVDEAFLSSIAYVYENFEKRITLSELCKLAQMSRTAYLTRFKRVTGLSPASLQRQYRVSVAKQMLCESGMTESKIAAETGFFDAAHFHRVFKKETGISPLEYRMLRKIR